MKTQNTIIVTSEGNTFVNFDNLRKYCFKIIPQILRNTLANRQDTEDLVQEAITKIYQVKSKFNPSKAKDTTWIYRIVTNLCFDFYRNGYYNKNFSMDISLNKGGDSKYSFADFVLDDSQKPDYFCCVKDQIEQIFSLRERMNKKYFDTVYYIEYLGYNGLEVSRILGIDYKYVAVYKQRGLEQIRNLLKIR